MGGRQPKKKEKKVNVEARPAEAENVVERKVPMGTLETEIAGPRSKGIPGVEVAETESTSPSNEEYKVLSQLSDVRVDDPRVISLPSEDPRLVLDRFNVRKEKDNYFVERLHKSLIEEGQQRPIIVTPRGEELWVVAGNTRVRAARLGKKIERIYALPTELNDEQAWFLALQSNLDNRLPLNGLDDEEQGRAIIRLMDEYGWSQQKIAELMHRDKRWVSNQVHLSKVDPQIEKMMKSGAITESHAEAIMTLPKNFQGDVADRAEEDKLTVQQTQKLVNEYRAILKVGEGVNEDTLREAVLNPFMDGDMKLERAVEATKAISVGLSLLAEGIKDTGYGRDEDFASTVIEKKMNLEGAQTFAESLNTLAKETEELPKEARDNVVESVLDGSRGLEDARVAIQTIQIASKSKALPKHIRELAVKEFQGSKYREIGKYDVEAAQKLVSTLETVFDDDVKKFSAGTQTKLAERIIDKKYKLETAQKLANTIEVALEESKDLPDKSLRMDLIKHVIDHNYTADSAKQLVTAVNQALLKDKKSSYEIQSELSWRQPKDWKVLKLTPEIEAAHKEDEEQRRLDEEADSVATLDDMVRNGELTSSSADFIRVLPKILQGEVADSLTYYDGDGAEQLLSMDGIGKMVSAVRQRIEGKPPDEIRQLIQTHALNAVLDAETYLEKPKEEPATERAEPQAGISEQLFGKHISGEVPVASAASAVAAATPQVSLKPSTEDLETAENLDSIAATALEEPTAETTINCTTGVKTSTVQRIVNKAGSTVLKLMCPCCDEPIILDPLKMVANWQQDLKED